jgi:anti-sigma factor RsiW
MIPMVNIMHCPDCESQLIDYACHELPDSERAAMAGHLAQCSGCALEYCRLQADLEGITEANTQAPRARVFHQLRRELAREYGASWWARARGLFVRPVPIYGAVLVSMVPVALWVFSVALAVPSLPTTTSSPGTPSSTAPGTPPSATLTDYGATEPSPAHRNVL